MLQSHSAHQCARRAGATLLPATLRCRAVPAQPPTPRSRACSTAASSSSAAVDQVLEQTLRDAAAEAEARPLTTAFLLQSLRNYTARTPSVHIAVEAFLSPTSSPGRQLPVQARSLSHDHYAFRTLGLPGLGIASVAQVLQELGYTLQEEGLLFPAKKLTASWFAFTGGNTGARKGVPPHLASLLPRIFVSEIQVERLSPVSQAIIHDHVSGLLGGRGLGPAEVATACATGALPWPAVTAQQYQALLKESDYAAWVMVHGYALNHTALAVHNMVGPDGRAGGLTLLEAAGAMAAHGLDMNQDGGLIKVSGDGLLRQCSSMSDGVPSAFAGAAAAGSGPALSIPGSYLELVERAPLPQFAHLKASELREWHRRDGFEVANAAHLFTSTRAAAGAASSSSS